MTIRLFNLAVASALLFAVGCAAAPDDENAVADGDETASEENAENEGEESDMPKVAMNGMSPQASGMSCSCPAGQQFQNGLCYPACASGWVGEGPVCWQSCAAGFTDTGFFCHRDSKIISANTSSCPWYNKCGWGSECNKCPAGYANDGCTCRIDAYIYAQPSYGRGAGTTPTCTTY